MTTARGTQPVPRGSKVLLRPWTPDDADDVFAAWQNGGGAFAVVDPATGRLAGSIGVHGMRDGGAARVELVVEPTDAAAAVAVRGSRDHGA